MTGTQIIAAGLGLAGNTSLDSTLALGALNRLLDKLYRKKFSWQRLTANVAFTAGVAFNTAQWPSTFLDIYEHDDGTSWRATINNQIVSGRALTYRQYINRPDRLSATGSQPRFIAHDSVAGRWYVYPLLDAALTVDVDYYQKPADIAAGDTPLWSSHASDDILVEGIKVWAYEWQDDDRYERSLQRLAGEVGAYRRKDQAKEGIVHQTALDPRIFRRNPGDD